jgi:hypothetical protein
VEIDPDRELIAAFSPSLSMNISCTASFPCQKFSFMMIQTDGQSQAEVNSRFKSLADDPFLCSQKIGDLLGFNFWSATAIFYKMPTRREFSLYL